MLVALALVFVAPERPASGQPGSPSASGGALPPRVAPGGDPSATPRVSQRREPLAPAELAAQQRAQTEQIAAVLNSAGDIAEKANELIRLLPGLNAEVQVLAASHISDLAEAPQLAEAVKSINDPKIHQDAREKLFSAIYNLNDPLEAAALLIDVLDSGKGGPFAEEAEGTLGILLQADHGTDVAAWRKELAAHQAAAASR